MSQPVDAPRLSPVLAWSLAVGATLTMAVSYFDRQTMAALGPSITQALGISSASWGWLFSAFSVAYLLGAPLAGRMLDRVGARRGLLGAVLLWSAVSALHAVVPGFAVLFAMRLALGFAEAPSFPGAAQTVARALSPHDRAFGFGILFTGSSFGAMLAPILASFLADRFGWRVALLGTAMAGLVWVPIWLLLTRPPAARAVLDPAPSPRPIPDATGQHPKGMLAILHAASHPAVLRASVVVVATAPLVGFILAFGALYLNAVEGVPQAEMGGYLWLPPVLFDLGSIAFGFLGSSYARARSGEPAKALFFFCGILACSLALLLVVRGPTAAMVICGAALAGVGGLFAIFTADMLSRVPPELVSTAAGITAAAQSLAYVVTQPILGWSVDVTGGYTAAIVVLCSMVMPGVVTWLVWKPPPLQGVRAVEVT